jgi:hypothetical protein
MLVFGSYKKREEVSSRRSQKLDKSFLGIDVNSRLGTISVKNNELLTF